jgi:hypothetical protein
MRTQSISGFHSKMGTPHSLHYDSGEGAQMNHHILLKAGLIMPLIHAFKSGRAIVK